RGQKTDDRWQRTEKKWENILSLVIASQRRSNLKYEIATLTAFARNDSKWVIARLTNSGQGGQKSENRGQVIRESGYQGKKYIRRGEINND
ncbi:hypothetical protein KAS42_06185, partial [bacterium]|nr:hypothetical protein [bacterium]